MRSLHADSALGPSRSDRPQCRIVRRRVLLLRWMVALNGDIHHSFLSERAWRSCRRLTESSPELVRHFRRTNPVIHSRPHHDEQQWTKPLWNRCYLPVRSRIDEREGRPCEQPSSAATACPPPSSLPPEHTQIPRRPRPDAGQRVGVPTHDVFVPLRRPRPRQMFISETWERKKTADGMP